MRMQRDHVQTTELQRFVWGCGLTTRRLSRESGVPERVIYRIRRARTRFTALTTAVPLLRSMGLTVDDLHTAWIVNRDARGRERLYQIERKAG